MELNYKKHRCLFESKYENQKYYTVKEIIKRLGVCLRHVRSRIAELRQKHEGNKRMMYKDKDNRWHISTHILDKFYPQKKHKKPTRYSQEWKTFITWAMKDNYSESYHNFLADRLRELFPNRKRHEWLFVVEKTKKGVNHVHALAMEPYQNVFSPLYDLLEYYRQGKDFDLMVGEVLSANKAERYLRK
jgi:hypothetical protein